VLSSHARGAVGAADASSST